MTKQLGWESPPNMAIAENASTPNPGIPGVEIWSTVSGKKLVWNGSKWIGSMTIISDPLQTNSGDSTKPTSDIVKLTKSVVAGIPMLSQISYLGEKQQVQNNIWKSKVAIWNPAGDALSIPSSFGFQSFLILGTATVRNVGVINVLTRMKSIAYLSAATAGNLSGLRQGYQQYTTGNNSNVGGFFLAITFAFTDASPVSGARAFAGMCASNATPTNVEPSSLVNSVGLAQLSTDNTQLYMVYGGSVAQSPIPLGTGFPPMAGTGATNGVPYTLILYAPRVDPLAATHAPGIVYYHLFRLDTATEISGSISTSSGTGPGIVTPDYNTPLSINIWRSNNAQNLAVGIDISNIYLESWN